jgi:RNA-directed DNA polymerase
MARDLARIGEKARQSSPERFTSIDHYVTDLDHLRACFEGIDPNKATGIDGVTKEEYGEDLEHKLIDLAARLGRLGYRAQPVRRVYIPKVGSDKKRP